MSPIPELKTACSKDFLGLPSLENLMFRGKTALGVVKPVDITISAVRPHLLTDWSGILLPEDTRSLKNEGPKTRYGLEHMAKVFDLYGFQVEMLKERGYLIRMQPKAGGEPFLLDRGTKNFAEIPDGNACISDNASEAILGLMVLPADKDPKIYDKVRQKGLALAHRYTGGTFLETLLLPAHKAIDAGLIGEGNGGILYSFDSCEIALKFSDSFPEFLEAIGHPVAVVIR